MRLKINGVLEDVPEIATVADLIRIKNLQAATAVVELNGALIKTDQWEKTPVGAGDSVEILRFVGGG
ncbi:MAG: sulfur carrier protein ThiS [Bacillota bacterium]